MRGALSRAAAELSRTCAYLTHHEQSVSLHPSHKSHHCHKKLNVKLLAFWTYHCPKGPIIPKCWKPTPRPEGHLNETRMGQSINQAPETCHQSKWWQKNGLFSLQIVQGFRACGNGLAQLATSSICGEPGKWPKSELWYCCLCCHYCWISNPVFTPSSSQRKIQLFHIRHFGLIIDIYAKFPQSNINQLIWRWSFSL